MLKLPRETIAVAREIVKTCVAQGLALCVF